MNEYVMAKNYLEIKKIFQEHGVEDLNNLKAILL